MYYDRIRKAEQVTRLPSGEVQCGDSHYGGYYSRSERFRPAAVAVFMDGHEANDWTSLAFVCKKHAGTVKANITKGSYSFRDVHPVSEFGIELEAAAADPEGTIVAIAAILAARKRAQQQHMEELELARVRAGWDERRAEYAVEDLVEFKSFAKPDEYGRVYVGLSVGRSKWAKAHIELTPTEARKLAEFLPGWADNAERLTNEQVKP